MNTKHFLRAYINDSNGWIPRMNDSSAPGFDNGRNDSSRYPVCEICATDDCRWPFFFENLLWAREGEKKKKKIERKIWMSRRWDIRVWNLEVHLSSIDESCPRQKGLKNYSASKCGFISQFFSSNFFLNVRKEKDKCYPAGVFHISIGVLVLYRMSGVEMKEEFFIGRALWQPFSPRIFIWIHIFLNP